MKKIAIPALVVCVVILGMTAGAALADRAKPALKPYTGNFGGTQTCGGFVIFSNSKVKAGANNLHVTVSLKNADLSNTTPNVSGDTTFSVWLNYKTEGGAWVYNVAPGTTLTINAQGNGNCHINAAVPTTGKYELQVQLCPASYPSWTAFQSEFAELTFK